MTALNSWLQQATRCLSIDSAAQVRAEIQEHYEAEHEALISRGVSASEAEALALNVLGNAKAANRQYRKVLLTAAEEKLLRRGNSEAHAVSSRPWLKWTMLLTPVAAQVVALALFAFGSLGAARGTFLTAFVMALFFTAPFWPIYTPARARVYRIGKWVAITGIFALILGADALRYSWLWASCLWIPFMTEWMRFSIRKKLPVAKWPKQLYL